MATGDLTASYVSRLLRQAGLAPQGGDYPRSREALRVSKHPVPGTVAVSADFNTFRRAERVADSAAEALTDAGLTVERSSLDPTSLRVTR